MGSQCHNLEFRLHVSVCMETGISKSCNLEPESIGHFLLTCPKNATEITKFLADLLNVLESDADYIASLRAFAPNTSCSQNSI